VPAISVVSVEGDATITAVRPVKTYGVEQVLRRRLDTVTLHLRLLSDERDARFRRSTVSRKDSTTSNWL